MSLLPRLRVALGRRPWLHPLIVGTLALFVWWQATAAQHAAQRARRSWGATTTVWVAEAVVVPGDPIPMRREAFPVAMVPTDALRTPPDDAVAAREVAAGAVLVQADLTSADDVPDGWSVFAVPAGGAPAVRVSDAVGVFAAGRHLCDGMVRGVEGDRVEVAVSPDCAPDLSADLAADDVILARLP